MKILIIGCGNMGSALAKGFDKNHQIFLYDSNKSAMKALSEAGFGYACETPTSALPQMDFVILAVKPQNLEEIAKELNPSLRPDHTLISLLAGTSVATLKKYFPVSYLIRTMPNLALIHGEGVIGIAENEGMDQSLKDRLTTLFHPLGKVHWIPESKMHALTSLTGSGPAFIFTFIEAMVEAGIAMGFTAHEAQELILQMIKGSITLLQETHKHPSELKWQVASPSGTTIAGLVELERAAVRGKIISGFLAAYERSQQMNSEKK